MEEVSRQRNTRCKRDRSRILVDTVLQDLREIGGGRVDKEIPAWREEGGGRLVDKEIPAGREVGGGL